MEFINIGFMKTITIKSFELCQVNPADYNHNSEFESSYRNEAKLFTIKFGFPDDAYPMSHRYWDLYAKGLETFREFNKANLTKGTFQTIVILPKTEIDSIELSYYTKDERIKEINKEIDNLNNEIIKRQREIEKLT